MPHHDPAADPEQLASDRLEVIHVYRMGVDELARSLGSPTEWLDTAIGHLKVQMSGQSTGSIEVSVAALHLVMMRLEQLEHGGAPWSATSVWPEPIDARR